ncbi:MAG TPA: hypothetical protein VJT31_27480 [Rugosimonospora sp.]|nr:hypothetical protein [Rugosimonospora sp.]
MAGDRGGRRSKGPRHPTMVRLPVDHYEHYVRQAEALQIPIGDFIAYRMAVHEGLAIPSEVLVANPGLLALLPEAQRQQALSDVPGLATRYRALARAAAQAGAAAEPLPFDGVDRDPEADLFAA